MSLSLYARFQRDLASGVTSVSRAAAPSALPCARLRLPPSGTLPCGRDCARSSPGARHPLATPIVRRLAASGHGAYPPCPVTEPVGCANTSRARCCRGRCWVRTSDLLGVNEARSHCANRPRGGGGNRTRVQGFAGPCLSHSAPPPAPTFPAGGIMALDIRRTVRAWGLRDGIRRLRADDGIRTRDPHLGKVMRYHCATSALPPKAYSGDGCEL